MKLPRMFCSCALLVFCLLLLTAQTAQAQQGVTSPGPVTNVALTSGNASITSTWGPPTNNGGSPITSYTVSCAPAGGSSWYDYPVNNGNATSHTATLCGKHHNPLRNGTNYAFRVKANNYWSNGDDTEATIVWMVAGLPAAPTGLTATAGDHEVALSWTAGSNNGSALTKYQYQQNGGSWANMANSGASTTSYTVTGLTNGTQYTFKVRAVNTPGNGVASAAVTATPVGPPEKPTGLTASDGNTQVTLSWTAPSNNGGAAITGYKYSKDNGTNWTSTGGTGTTYTVTGLTNGTAYTFKVLAVNTHDDGAESDAAKATPATTPAAPTNLSAADTAKVSGGEVKLTWTAPTNTGGAAITGYKYSKDDGSSWTATGATSTNHTVTGLTNGTAYKFKVRAVNRKGDGTASAVATATPATTPLAPGSLSAALPSGEAKKVTLTWTTPSNRGAAIESYNYRQNGGGWTNIPNSGASTTSYTVPGLNNGTQYRFEVRAKNRKGNSAIAGPATATTPDVPAAPTNLTATDTDRQVTLSWTAPNNGGLAITGYEYSKDDGSSWAATGTNTSATVTSLTNGTEYTFKVRAVNAAGNGAVATVTATPATTPAAPTLTTPVIEGNKQVRLTWTAPTNTGGAAITGYDYSKNNGTSWTATNSTATSTLVTGLTNGTEYTFKVRAVNRKGDGTASAQATATPWNFTATAGNRSVALNWNALQTTATIAKWQYQQSGGTWADIPNSIANTRSYTVTGLENGTAYTFQGRALDSNDTPVEQIEFPAATPRQPPSTNITGGGGGGTDTTNDQHGNDPATATAIAAGSSTPGEINAPTDVDYFALTVPQAGLLVVETTGSTDTQGRLTTQDGQVLAQADDGGTRRNFQLARRVAAGTYLVAVTGRGTGSYRLEVDLLVGFVDNPQPASAQSGLGVLSGWVCEAETVEIELDGVPQQATYGTERTDTVGHCGDTDNGFGLLWNWNLLGDGEHTVRVVVDGIVFATLPVTVTTLGLDTDFPTGLTGGTTLTDFPSDGETVRLVWQEAQQNFVLAEGAVTRQGNTRDPEWAFLENPRPGSYQSGISVLSGWVCEAEEVVLEIDGIHRLIVAYGTERTDTEEKCGDTDNGFGLLWNWNLFGPGPHTVRLLVDGEEWATAAFTITTLGAEMVRGLTHTAEVADFPSSGAVVTVEWQEAQQNFVITGVGE